MNSKAERTRGEHPSVEVSLVARINRDGCCGMCVLCGRARERMLGMTETYLAVTEEWVCVDCADLVDPELAAFAYRPELPRKKRLKVLGEEWGYFGVCPECGDPGEVLNIGKHHWNVCRRHGLRWSIGYNIFSTWQYQTEEDWRRNEEQLLRCREVHAIAPRHSPLVRMRRRWRPVMYRIRQAWRPWRDRQRLPDVPDMDDEIPF